MKKVGILLLGILALSLISFTLANAEPVDPNNITIPKDISTIVDLSQQGKDAVTKSYLGEEWRKIFLKNDFVAFVDSVFTKFSFVFFILFGQNYLLSLKLFLVIILWFYFLFLMGKMFEGVSPLSPSTSLAVSLGVTVMLAHMQIFKGIVDFLDWLVFTKKGWMWNLAIAIAEIIALIIIYYAGSKFSKVLRMNQEAFKKIKEGTEEEVRKIELEAAKNAAEKEYGVNDVYG